MTAVDTPQEIETAYNHGKSAMNSDEMCYKHYSYCPYSARTMLKILQYHAFLFGWWIRFGYSNNNNNIVLTVTNFDSRIVNIVTFFMFNLYQCNKIHINYCKQKTNLFGNLILWKCFNSKPFELSKMIVIQYIFCKNS